MKSVDQLDHNARYWMHRSLTWAGGFWNDKLALVQGHAHRRGDPRAAGRYVVRDTVWYAAGLLTRRQSGDVGRAIRAIEAILAHQWDAPGKDYHGTFRRYAGEPTPPDPAAPWRHYDPNWREFICTTLIVLLHEFTPLLPGRLRDRMRSSIRMAAEGAYARRVPAEYTNISLMSAFLLQYAGEAFGAPSWRAHALRLGKEIHELYAHDRAFCEFNSPTYYGIDLYALALWRKFGLTASTRALGASMEAGLWRDVARFYHAGMKNLCGPYDRAYGMDMTRYLAAAGLWIAAVLPPEQAPLPDVDRPFDHAGDYYLMPVVALVGSTPPKDAAPHLAAFQGERYLEREIEAGREATAWLSDKLMLGAEADTRRTQRSEQFHPATVHWVTPHGDAGWMRARCEAVIQARAQPKELVLTSPGAVVYEIEICTRGVDPRAIQPTRWDLPGLAVHVDARGARFSTVENGDVLALRLATSNPVRLGFST